MAAHLAETEKQILRGHVRVGCIAAVANLAFKRRKSCLLTNEKKKEEEEEERTEAMKQERESNKNPSSQSAASLPFSSS